MSYLLDTNICIYLIKKKSEFLIAKIEKIAASKLFLSSITVAELEYGVEKSQHKEKNALALSKFLLPFQLIPFDELAAKEFGKLRAGLEARGKPIGVFDMQIAAIALTHQLTLITNNTREFERVPNLELENWTK
ncbi:MAG: PilT protein [uncultured bacterium]|nr:MAG: PilT protein [uncultured bacterium]